jgi:hypothetical protein
VGAVRPFLVAAVPVRGVALFGRHQPFPDRVFWMRAGFRSAVTVPGWLYDDLPPGCDEATFSSRGTGRRTMYYPTPVAAHDALSVAAVRWARRVAGLPVPADPALAF